MTLSLRPSACIATRRLHARTTNAKAACCSFPPVKPQVERARAQQPRQRRASHSRAEHSEQERWHTGAQPVAAETRSTPSPVAVDGAPLPASYTFGCRPSSAAGARTPQSPYLHSHLVRGAHLTTLYTSRRSMRTHAAARGARATTAWLWASAPAKQQQQR